MLAKSNDPSTWSTYEQAKSAFDQGGWEGFGFVILEALACGLPVVASIADGTREAVRNGELGVVVDPKDPAALLSAIVEALRRPKQIPAGLAYFSFGNFASRLRSALGRVIDI